MPFFWQKNKNFIILAILIVLQLILISVQTPLGEEENYFERAAFFLFSPLQHGIVSFAQGIGNIWTSYFDLRKARDENEEMRKELFFLTQENNLLKNALKNYKTEKEILDLLQRLDRNILHARVIGIDASNYHKSVMINKGALDGIKKNMVILDKSGHLVGRIIGPIALKESRVQLITDNECGVSVFTQKEKALGILKGDGKGGCKLAYILSTDQNVFEGDNLITSGFDGIFPPGIAVGEIVAITQTEELFKDIRVKPHFEFRHLDQLAVIMVESKDLS
jgi:rod shape-determining protein MreC